MLPSATSTGKVRGEVVRNGIRLVVAGAVLAACGIVAQEPLRGPDSGSIHKVPGVEVLTIPGKPFSAKSSIEWTRTLEDGSTVTTHLDASLARDSQGRVYRENHSFVPAGSGRRSPLNEVHIYDPVTRSQLHCSTHALQCVLTDYSPRTFFETRSAGTFDDGARSMSRDSLGSRTIEGIFVTGTLETTTVNAGVLGNDRPLVSTREFWYSDQLRTNLAVTRNDPREGKQVIQLSAIAVGVPDQHLFEVPLGYTLRDLRASARRKR